MDQNGAVKLTHYLESIVALHFAFCLTHFHSFAQELISLVTIFLLAFYPAVFFVSNSISLILPGSLSVSIEMENS